MLAPDKPANFQTSMIHSITILASNTLELSRQSEILIEKGFRPFEEPWAFAQGLAQVWVCDLGLPSVAQHKGVYHDD